jgi:hypothetical protein
MDTKNSEPEKIEIFETEDDTEWEIYKKIDGETEVERFKRINDDFAKKYHGIYPDDIDYDAPPVVEDEEDTIQTTDNERRNIQLIPNVIHL